MSDSVSANPVWFRLGYALERARQKVSPHAPAGESEKPRTVVPPSDPPATAPLDAGRLRPPADPMLDFAAAWLERTVAARLLRSNDPGRGSLARAAVAGTGAELAAIAVHTMLSGPRSEDADGATALKSLLGGAAEGLVYASLVRPLVPGPTWARGAAFGLARYFAARGGGLAQVLGPLSPHRRIPLLDSLVAPRPSGDDVLVEHLVAGLTLAVLYESSDLRSGTTPEASD